MGAVDANNINMEMCWQLVLKAVILKCGGSLLLTAGILKYFGSLS